MNRDQWAAIIEQQGQSRLSVESFCEQQDIGLASFGKWKRRLRDDAAKPLHTAPTQKSFAPVRLIEPVESERAASTSVSVSIGENVTLTIQTCGSAV